MTRLALMVCNRTSRGGHTQKATCQKLKLTCTLLTDSAKIQHGYLEEPKAMADGTMARIDIRHEASPQPIVKLFF